MFIDNLTKDINHNPYQTCVPNTNMQSLSHRSPKFEFIYKRVFADVCSMFSFSFSCALFSPFLSSHRSCCGSIALPVLQVLKMSVGARCFTSFDRWFLFFSLFSEK